MAVTDNVAKRNNVIDAIRFFAIALIVYLHVYQLPETINTQLNTIPTIFARLGVPIFFAISGYMLYTANKNKTRSRARISAYKTLVILLGAFLLYGIIDLVSGNLVLTGARDIYNLVVYNLVDFSAGPLWFLVSLIYVNLIFWAALKFGKNENWLIVASIIILGTLLFILPYGTLNNINVEYTQAYFGKGWLFALPFFSLGYFVHKYYDLYLKNFTTKGVVKAIALLAPLYVGEYILLSSFSPVEFGFVNYELYLFMIPLVFCILLLALKLKNTKDNIFSYIGQKYSLYLYIVHTAVIMFVVKVLSLIGIEQFDTDRWVLALYIAVLAISLGLSVLYVYAKRRITTKTK